MKTALLTAAASLAAAGPLLALLPTQESRPEFLRLSPARVQVTSGTASPAARRPSAEAAKPRFGLNGSASTARSAATADGWPTPSAPTAWTILAPSRRSVAN